MLKKVFTLVLILSFVAYGKPKIEIEDPWVRAVPPNMKNSALFMEIENEGDEADVLLKVESDISKMVQLHKTVNENGVMKMVHIDKLVIPPHSEVKLKPGGYHIMLMGLKKPLKEGDKVKFTLIFKKSGKIQIEAPVKAK
ncbi:MAG: copper chaperone PCu(A)C [Aquificae bacterium]|nr:copper chaperone PCu(A)C [Aquificota bacterium]